MTETEQSGAIVLVETRGELDVITLNRPERLNAINQPMVETLLSYFEGRRRRAATRVVILRGAGRGFCSGADLKAGGQPDQLQDGPRGDWMLRDLIKAMRACPQPIIALVHGAAAGGGLALALASDIIIAAESAQFHTSFIKIGLSGSELGVAWRLQRAIGLSRAREAMFTSRPIGAADALVGGLVARVAPDSDLDEAGLIMARKMLEAAPDALRLTKRSLDSTLEIASFDVAMEIEERAQMLMIARQG
jgi:enoyl-CoA hydratase/carnithine racemase